MSTNKDRTCTALKKRIAQFYAYLNRGDSVRCHQMIDPRVRAKPSSVTLLQYENSLREFLASVGAVTVVKTQVQLHLGESSKLYEDRDFATGETMWDDEDGRSHVFQERWVREGRSWFTRTTGFLAPVMAAATNGGRSRGKQAVRK